MDQLLLLNFCSFQDTTVHDLIKLIDQDQALKKKILNIANSAYYAIPGGVSDLSHALKHLGILTLETIFLIHFDSMEGDCSGSA